MNTTKKQLTEYGFSNYTITKSGKVYKLKPHLRELKRDNYNRFYLTDDNGNKKRLPLKQLYRMAYNKEFCIDNIKNLFNEEWHEIQGTNGKYLISNCGRVKSLCGYIAILLQQQKNEKGYLTITINKKRIKVHRLVAFSFCENKYIDQKTEIHHKDLNRTNNKADNLMILSIKEHHKIHNTGELKE